MRSALLVVNARSRDGKDAGDAAHRQLEQRGWRVARAPEVSSSEIARIIRQSCGSHDCVTIVGGDGTLNQCLDVLHEVDALVGVVPAGTANDFARSLGLPTSVEEACRIIDEGREQRVDLARANEKIFANAASIGLSVAITSGLDRGLKKRWGPLSYARVAMRVIRNSKPMQAQVRWPDGGFRARTYQIVVGNGRHYGGGMTVDKNATITDHLLHLYSLEPKSRWRMFSLWPAIWSGRYSWTSSVRTVQHEKFVLATSEPCSVNTDGELTTQTPVEFRLLPNALRVLISKERE